MRLLSLKKGEAMLSLCRWAFLISLCLSMATCGTATYTGDKSLMALGEFVAWCSAIWLTLGAIVAYEPEDK